MGVGSSSRKIEGIGRELVGEEAWVNKLTRVLGLLDHMLKVSSVNNNKVNGQCSVRQATHSLVVITRLKLSSVIECRVKG